MVPGAPRSKCGSPNRKRIRARATSTSSSDRKPRRPRRVRCRRRPDRSGMDRTYRTTGTEYEEDVERMSNVIVDASGQGWKPNLGKRLSRLRLSSTLHSRRVETLPARHGPLRTSFAASTGSRSRHRRSPWAPASTSDSRSTSRSARIQCSPRRPPPFPSVSSTSRATLSSTGTLTDRDADADADADAMEKPTRRR